MWQHVIPHFSAFLRELELKPEERDDANSKAESIARCLWKNYYGGEFNSNCYVKVGSYGKQTAIRPSSDLDILFILPPAAYYRVERLLWNKQSQLLQEVKSALEDTFPRTDLRADGQVVVAPFQTYKVEIIPAFSMTGGTYITAHTENGGSWRPSNPIAEYQAIRDVDNTSIGKATDLTKMLKAWKRECSVDIKSISLEVSAWFFLKDWKHRQQSIFYYDWMIRDYFAFMFPYENGKAFIPGTGEIVELGNNWMSKCNSAYNHALKACMSEELDHPYSAAEEWQKIFGTQFTGAAPFGSLSFLAKAMGAAR